MGSLSSIKDEVVREFLMEKFLIMDKVQVVINELLLDCPIVTLDVRVDLRAVRIGKEVRYTLPHEVLVKFP